jgi:hypothetical protein
MNSVSKQEHKELFDALHFMNMKELREFCNAHGIPSTEKKGALIEKIMHFVKTGIILPIKELPNSAFAKKGTLYPLEPNTQILHGSFKNDLKTRIFFKKLIGDHFHFTAFGIDWIEERWFAGKPPTYQEFATMWQREYERRKKTKAQPKKEWALLNFMQRYQEQNPNASKQEVMREWKKEREKQVNYAQKLLIEPHTA